MANGVKDMAGKTKKVKPAARKKGGAQPGAGRPTAYPGRSKEAPITIKISAEAREIADRRAAERGLETIQRAYNRSEYIEALIRADGA
jgi:hypothetical protein